MNCAGVCMAAELKPSVRSVIVSDQQREAEQERVVSLFKVLNDGSRNQTSVVLSSSS